MTSKQILAILLTVVLAAAIYFAPKIGTVKKEETFANPSGSFEEQFELAKKSLTPEQTKIFNQLDAKLQLAEKENNDASWVAAGDEFLKAARYFQDDNKAVLYKGAIDGFEKAMGLNPKNLNARIGLGSAKVEASGILGTQPMDGIRLLKEVEAEDSSNIEVNLQLGLFSLTSRQFDKAIDRFKKILRIDSTHIDMYVYLGDTYMTMGEKDKAIESYENYKVRVKDTLITKDIDEYIKKLKQQP